MMDRVRRRRAGDHVARVLDVAGGVGDDELASRRGEVAVGHVDGDALFAFGAQAVGEIGEVDLAVARDVGGTLEGFELVFHQRLGVVEQAADERGFAVVHAATGVEAQEIDGRRMGRGHLEIKSLVMGPHPQNFDGVFSLTNLVNKTVLDIDAP